MSNKTKNTGSNYQQIQRNWKIARVVVLIIACIFALFPVIWIVSASLNPAQSMSSQTIIPSISPPIVEASEVSGTIQEILVEEGQRVVRSSTVIMRVEVDGESVSVNAPRNGYISFGDGVEVGAEIDEGQDIFSVGTSLFINFDVLLTTDRFPFMRWIFNSVVVSGVTAVIVVMVTALSAYSFSRFRFTGRDGLLVFILLVQVFPNLLAMVAIFLFLQQIGQHIPQLGLNTQGGLILVYVGGAMGINIWLMKGFFDSVPRDIDESALVDGASHWQTYRLLIFPLVRPILIVVGILSFVGTFNEFVLARVLLRDKESWTLMVGLWSFIADNFARDWGVFAAGSVIGAIPTLVIYLALQDQIVGGLTQGSVKG